MEMKRGQQSIAKPFGKPAEPDTNAVVCPDNFGVAGRCGVQCDTRSRYLQKGSPRIVDRILAFACAHLSAPALRSNSLVPAMDCREDSSMVPAPFQCVSRLIVPRYPSCIIALNCW